MGKQLITVAVIAVGLALLVVSYLVPESHGGSWSEEQEQQYQQVQAQWHELYARNASGKTGGDSLEFQAATAAKEKMDQELADAQNASGRTARTLFWAGLVVTAVGLASYPFTRPRDA